MFALPSRYECAVASCRCCLSCDRVLKGSHLRWLRFFCTRVGCVPIRVMGHFSTSIKTHYTTSDIHNRKTNSCSRPRLPPANYPMVLDRSSVPTRIGIKSFWRCGLSIRPTDRSRGQKRFVVLYRQCAHAQAQAEHDGTYDRQSPRRTPPI